MKQELQDKLYKKCPKLFSQKDLPKTQTCMCWGISTGDGWYDLIDNVCEWIQNHTRWNPHLFPPIEFTQVKEKFGQLRIYFQQTPVSREEFSQYKKDKDIRLYIPKPKNIFLKVFRTIWKVDEYKMWLEKCREGYEEISGVISFAEHLSATICDRCGSKGEIRRYGWVFTLCDTCAANHRKERGIGLEQEEGN